MDYVNSIRLVGRVAAVGEPRELPSGDVVVTMRVVVPREGPGRRPRGSVEAVRPGTGVDTIDVACWSAASRRAAGGLSTEDHVEVEGSLRRRFFRTGAGVASRYEVEARRLRRVKAVVERAG
ncbi:single-stranded DNA-binding protein [Oryzobacter telluris]|uniref:single-stranded DNA-binding protein n=1 Tax=Oryzobacter telluris TaxID=3149179 RepID=UPI00370D7F63